MIAYPFIEAKIYTVDNFKVEGASLHLPDNMERLRIVFVSDIHWGHWFSDWDLGRLVSKINDLYPDVLIFGGDYATDFESSVLFFEHLRKYSLNTRLRNYAVLGETDYIGEEININRLKDAMNNAGIRPLIDSTETISLLGDSNPDGQSVIPGRICFVGADDYTAGFSNLKTLVSSPDISSSEYVVFSSHNPAVIPAAQNQKDGNNSFDWFELGLFGHTHGGQIRFFESLLEIADDVPDHYLEKAYGDGKLNENRSWLIMSHGIGTSVLPFRLFCYPQINCVDIYP